MLTGSAAFGGETVTDVLASVVKEDPDWGSLPARVACDSADPDSEPDHQPQAGHDKKAL